MPQTPARIALVTGASRGIGAEVAQQLASPDTHVIINYREQAGCADTVAAAIRAAGGQASTIAADISSDVETMAMIETIAARFGRLDTLILNASGGLQRGADPGYAVHLNHDAQKRLATLAMPLMPIGGRIVFVTNHQAHFFPHKAVPNGYAAVAAGKHAGEAALHAMRSEFDHAGIEFAVVSGNMLDGATRIPLAAVSELATAVVKTATTPHSSGVVYIGSADLLLTA